MRMSAYKWRQRPWEPIDSTLRVIASQRLTEAKSFPTRFNQNVVGANRKTGPLDVIRMDPPVQKPCLTTPDVASRGYPPAGGCSVVLFLTTTLISLTLSTRFSAVAVNVGSCLLDASWPVVPLRCMVQVHLRHVRGLLRDSWG